MTCTKKSFLKQGSLNYPFGEDQTSSKCMVMFFGISLLNSALFGLVTYGFPLCQIGAPPGTSACPLWWRIWNAGPRSWGFFTGKKQVDQNWDVWGMFFWMMKKILKNITSQESQSSGFLDFFSKIPGENIVRELSECPAQVPKQALLGAQAGVNTWSSFCFVWSRGGGNGIENKNRRGLISFLAHICLKGCCTFSSFRLRNGSYLVRADVDPIIKREIKSICLLSLSLSSSFANKQKKLFWMLSKGKYDIVKNTNCYIY